MGFTWAGLICVGNTLGRIGGPVFGISCGATCAPGITNESPSRTRCAEADVAMSKAIANAITIMQQKPRCFCQVVNNSLIIKALERR